MRAKGEMAGQILAVMPASEDVPVAAITERLGLNGGNRSERHAVHNAMFALERKGAVVRNGRGMYRRVDTNSNGHKANGHKATGALKSGALRELLLAAVPGPTSVGDIAAAVGKPQRAISSTLTSLVRNGMLQRVDRGIYAPGKSAPAVPAAAVGSPTMPSGDDVRRRVSQDERLAAMLVTSGMRPRTEDDWLAVLQFIECARGVLS